MTTAKFSRAEVRSSFRKFSDTCTDLIQSDWHTWDNYLNILIDHCENNPVMKTVTDPLRHNPNVDIDAWYTEFQDSVGGMVGSGSYSLPSNDEDRTALYYKFLRDVQDGKIQLVQFCLNAFGSTDYNDMIYRVNNEFVDKFYREVKYRLQDLETELGADTEIAEERLFVFETHYHQPTYDQSTTVHGSISNSSFVAHSTNVSQSVLVTMTSEPVANLIEEIGKVLRADPTLSPEDRADASNDLESLKAQLVKTKKNPGMITSLIENLKTYSSVYSLVLKLGEYVVAMF